MNIKASFIDDAEQEALGTVEIEGKESIFLLKRLEFEPQLQRMSVVTKSNDKVAVVTKGAPERIRELSVQSSIPADFQK